MTLERLQKILAEAGVASRRRAEKMILAGRVKVNGGIVQLLGHKADPRTDRIEVDGRVLHSPEKKVYYLFYKPVGYLTTLQDPFSRPTIAQFLTEIESRVYPVGRLDLDAEGLLILTNDGELAARLMHPRYHVPKTYQVLVKGLPTDSALDRLSAGGIMLGERPAAPAEVAVVKKEKDRTWLRMTIREGRHRQIKRMCSTVGCPVMKLKRIAFGPLSLGRLTPGALRPLKPAEVEALKKAAF